jgi:DNA-3-methyladenine glycosylase
MKLNVDFYQNPDVEEIARLLLGKFLVSQFNGVITSGKIVESEAYAGVGDKASHAYNHRRTKRTEIMYREGGTAYVYFIYGMYNLFNVVTNKKDIPHAVLIRALEPFDGIEEMLKRRKLKQIKYNLSAGPGLLSQALGITVKHTGLSLLNSAIWIEDRAISVADHNISSGPRINVDYAANDALLHRRFWIKDNPWVSKAR